MRSAARAGQLPWVPVVLSARVVAALRWSLLAAALAPLARLLWLGASDRLGANPVELVIRSLGTTTLVLLCVTLAVTPVRRFTGWAWLARLRRMAGLATFCCAVLHFLAWSGIDQRFGWAAIVQDVFKRPYMSAGFAALLLLVPLAATSTNGMVRRLGGRAWQRLHRLGYLTRYWRCCTTGGTRRARTTLPNRPSMP